MKLEFSHDETFERIKIEAREDDGTGADIILNTYELDTVILNLAKARAKMSPEVPRTLDPAPVFKNVVVGPAFHICPGVEPGRMQKYFSLAFAHPGMGWIALRMSVDEALQLAQAIGVTALKISRESRIVGVDGKPLA